MKKLLCNLEGYILFVEDNIEYGTFEEEEKWKIGNFYYKSDEELFVYEVEELPTDYTSGKYFYTPDIGFYPNTMWVEPPKPVEQQISDLALRIAESEFEIDSRLTMIELGI